MKINKEEIKVTRKQFDCKHEKGFAFRTDKCSDCGLSLHVDLQVKKGFAKLVVSDENTNQNKKGKQNS